MINKNQSKIRNDISDSQMVQINNQSPITYEEPVIPQESVVLEEINMDSEKPIISEQTVVLEELNIPSEESTVSQQPNNVESVESTQPITDEDSTKTDSTKTEYWPDATTWTANFAPERTTKSLEHEVDRLTKRLQRVENVINRSTVKNTRLNRVFTGQFGELVRTAVRNQDGNTLSRLLAYADAEKHRASLVNKPEQQNNEQVSPQNQVLKGQLETALQTIKDLRNQIEKNEQNDYKKKYEELRNRYDLEEKARSHEPSITEQRDRAHRLLNEYRAKVAALTNELTMLQNSTGKYAIDEIIIEGTGVHVRYENNLAYVSSLKNPEHAEEISELKMEISRLENELADTKKLFTTPTIHLDVSGVRVREQDGAFIVEDDPDEPSSYVQQRYEELSNKYHSLEKELINTKQELSQAAENFEKMRGEIIELHGKKMAQKDTLVAYNESKVRELTNELNAIKSVLEGIMKVVH